MARDASTIEIAWTCIAVAGFVIQSSLLWDAFMDRRAARAIPAGNARRGRLIWGHLRSGFVFLMIHALFILAGANAMLNPEPPDYGENTLRKTITIAALMLAAILLVYVGFKDHRDRVFLRRSVEPEDPPRKGE